MTEPSASDKDLLERLNALKPTSVTLDPSQNSLGIPVPGNTAVPSSQPVSREDALTARLRSLRLGSSSPSPSPSRAAASVSPQPEEQSADTAATPSKGPSAARPQASIPLNYGGGEDEDPLHMDDEQVLNDFLEGLSGDEDFGSATADAAPKDEEAKVAALLKSLGRESRDRDSARHSGHDAEEHDSGDDSEGEAMKGEVSKLLAQAADEAELDRMTRQQDEPPGHDTADGDNPSDIKTSASPPPPSNTKSQADKPSTPSDPFSLPSVPSTLPPPPPTEDEEAEAESFESSIAARMAALQGISNDNNALGLPSAPTFAPDARAGSSTAYRKTAGRQGYTDEDEQTWCVVCLEDATVRCHGCDGDVYCARCFREMHVGPAAGYDERGHRWVKFERPGLR